MSDKSWARGMGWDLRSLRNARNVRMLYCAASLEQNR